MTTGSRTVRFVTCDVFTERPFAGNQLAVVFGAEGLETETLQAITREFNYSETTFVLPAESDAHARRVRIFTPEAELPFAGHPTVGTAHVLAATGEIPLPADGESTIVLGEGVGPVPVTVRMVNGAPVHAQLMAAQPPEERTPGVTREALAALLSLEVSDLADEPMSAKAVSCGLPWLLVPLANVDAVSRARVRFELWEKALGGAWASWPYVFAMTAGGNVDVQARAFLPGAAVPEDPATGSANASLAAFLAARSPREGALAWQVMQGIEMGRPSRLSIEAEKRDGKIVAVRVGGSTVIVSRGEMTVA